MKRQLQFNGGFHLVKSFTDVGLAGASYAPCGVRVIGGSLFVTYAFKASPADGDEIAGPNDEYNGLLGVLRAENAGHRMVD
jgi:hypothetical protein